MWLILLFWLPVVFFWSFAPSLLRLWRSRWIPISSLLVFGTAVAFLPLLGFWPTYYFRADIALFIFAADAVFLALVLLLAYGITRVVTNRQELPQTHSEVVGMTLLSQLGPAIAAALDSLGRKPTKSVADLYYLYASRHINISVDAFILLRRHHRVDGARLLVRPALETMLRLRAVHAKPYLLYQVLFAEAAQRDKWIGGVAKRHNIPYTPVCELDVWQEVKARCASEFGAEKLKDIQLSAYSAAEAIGLEAYYNSHYRAYCQYTHGVLEAVSGNLDELTDPEDTRVMLSSAMSALEVLVDIGADCPDMESFRQRFSNLMNQKPEKLFREKRT